METCPSCGQHADDLFLCRRCAVQVEAELLARCFEWDGFDVAGVYLSLPRPQRVSRDGSEIELWYDKTTFLACRHQLKQLAGDSTFFSQENLYRVIIDVRKLMKNQHETNRH